VPYTPDVNDNHYYSGNCEDERMQIGKRYIDILKASEDMQEICTSSLWVTSCVPEKVNVVCGNVTAV